MVEYTVTDRDSGYLATVRYGEYVEQILLFMLRYEGEARLPDEGTNQYKREVLPYHPLVKPYPRHKYTTNRPETTSSITTVISSPSYVTPLQLRNTSKNITFDQKISKNRQVLWFTPKKKKEKRENTNTIAVEPSTKFTTQAPPVTFEKPLNSTPKSNSEVTSGSMQQLVIQAIIGGEIQEKHDIPVLLTTPPPVQAFDWEAVKPYASNKISQLRFIPKFLSNSNLRDISKIYPVPPSSPPRFPRQTRNSLSNPGITFTVPSLHFPLRRVHNQPQGRRLARNLDLRRVYHQPQGKRLGRNIDPRHVKQRRHEQIQRKIQYNGWTPIIQ